MRGAVEWLRRDIGCIDVNGVLVRRAGELVETHALRAHDAVHLASAVEDADGDLVLASADAALLTVARALALTTIRPVG